MPSAAGSQKNPRQMSLRTVPEPQFVTANYSPLQPEYWQRIGKVALLQGPETNPKSLLVSGASVWS
jgi:hypothetical protein